MSHSDHLGSYTHTGTMFSLLPGESGPRRSTKHLPQEGTIIALESTTNDVEVRQASTHLGGVMATTGAVEEPQITHTHGSFSLSTTAPIKRHDSSREEFDIQRIPHYDGPYYVQYTEDGRRVQKRWCKFSTILSHLARLRRSFSPQNSCDFLLTNWIPHIYSYSFTIYRWPYRRWIPRVVVCLFT